MKPFIQQFFLNRQDPEQVARFKTFAASFNHNVDNMAHPYIIFHRDDKWIAYVQVVNLPMVFFAWHTNPEICKPSDVHNICTQVIGWTKIQFGGALCTRPIREETNFQRDFLEKFGGTCMNKELFEF